MPYRGFCLMRCMCPVRDCSVTVVPRQEEISGAATDCMLHVHHEFSVLLSSDTVCIFFKWLTVKLQSAEYANLLVFSKHMTCMIKQSKTVIQVIDVAQMLTF